MVQREASWFLPLTPAAFHILIALADGEKHGYAIMRDVADSTGSALRLGPATLYNTIRRLLESRLIAECASRPNKQMDDSRRRYYRLTTLGFRVAEAEANRLAEVVRFAKSKNLLRRPRPV